MFIDSFAGFYCLFRQGIVLELWKSQTWYSFSGIESRRWNTQTFNSSVRHYLVHINNIGKKNDSGWEEREIAPYNGDWSGRNMGVVFGGGKWENIWAYEEPELMRPIFTLPKIWLLEGVVGAGSRDRFWRLFLTIFHSFFINFSLAVIF